MANTTKISEYKNLLSYWHKLEHFTPAVLPKTDDVKKLQGIPPWDDSVRIQPRDPQKMERIHTVFIGVFLSVEVREFVKEYFNDKTSDPNFQSQKILYASLKIDNNGSYIRDTLGISTLPWALRQLENGRITEDDWSEAFNKTHESVLFLMEDLLSKKLCIEELEIIQDCIISNSGWSKKPYVELYVKSEDIYKKTNIKDSEIGIKPDLLNSFFISDLENIILALQGIKNLPRAFTDYLNGCLGKPITRIDLSKEIDEIKKSLLPGNFPDGCWPSHFLPGLMQQFAVNTVLNKLSPGSGIFSVNGPPGTGKTTLLRDIVAGILVERAKVMVTFSDPASAFLKTGQVGINDRYVPSIYAPTRELCEGGIVVASSNNGAVENVSKELPLKKEVEPYQDIGYFREVSENCVDDENWGLISAVLGNKENRRNMVNSIWFNEDISKAEYTLQNVLKTRIPTDQQWLEARNNFKGKLKEIGEEKKRLEVCIQNYERKLKVEVDMAEAAGLISRLEENSTQNKAFLEDISQQQIQLVSARNDILSEIMALKNAKPGFFTYWLNRTIRKEYKRAMADVLVRFNAMSSEISWLQYESQKLSKQQRELDNTLIKEKKNFSSLENENSQLDSKLQATRNELGRSFADKEFWSKLETKDVQEITPWYSERLKGLQSEIFVLSMKVNELFVLKANSISWRISSTLAGFFHYLRGDVRVTHTEAKAMWDTFFLVVPVVSTTFASIDRMFYDLKAEDLPWLFIDEAGQAVPQAAAGAIWRTKRVVVVGDPFQIEPVVTIPPQISDNLRKYFNLTSEQAGSDLSVQTMADRANKYGWFNNNIWIGSPLRVHRRCIDPMFSIANAIAYDGMMFNSTRPKEHKVNFSSSFIHVTGAVEGRHYVPEQAYKVIDILENEINIQKALPDIFVISPFTEIPYKLKGAIFDSLYQSIRNFTRISAGEMWEWLNTHVGTVHTFQGKQADGVILCLGLDSGGKGAAAWAASKPNILNVAITRAKHRFIAVGDKDIWLKLPYYNRLTELV